MTPVFNSRTRRRILRPDQVRGANRAAVLQLLRQYQRLSRAEIARRTGLSEGTISRIASDLLNRGLVVEEGAENSTGGRPGIRLRLDQSRFLSLGVDILSWETRVALGTIGGRVLETRSFRTPSTPARTVDLIVEQFETHRRKTPRGSLHGLGISTRGLVNSDTGVVELGSDPGWVRIPVKDLLEKELRRPVLVENDVRAAALAEYHHGSAEIQGSHCLLFVKVGEGVGMGVVLDGRLYRGPHMAAGEFGQMVVSDGDNDARHDRPGCLEKLASNPAICERYSRLSGNRYRTTSGDSAAQVKRICHLAMEGDAAARQTLSDTCRYLGIGIANMVWALDAEAVILDGALTEAWPLVASSIEEQFPVGDQFPNFRRLVLRPSSLAGEATMIAAVSLPFASLFATGETVTL